MPFLSVYAQFKNEAHILREWTKHYQSQGVEEFWLINNNSTDDYLDALSHLPASALHLNSDSRSHAQQTILMESFEAIRESTEWLIICDLDEFIYARKDFSTISEYLRSLDDEVSAVYIPWKLFGSSGQKRQPASVRKSFLHRTHYSNGAQRQGMPKPNRIFSKYIVRCCAVDQLHIHYCSLRQGTEVTSDGKAHRGKEDAKAYARVSESILKKSCLHLNHYAIQSHEFFFSVKTTRGDNFNADQDSARNASYFNAFDINERADTELRQIAINKG